MGPVANLIAAAVDAECELSNVMFESRNQEGHDGARDAMVALQDARKALGEGTQYDTALAVVEAARAFCAPVSERKLERMERWESLMEALAAHDAVAKTDDGVQDREDSGGPHRSEEEA